MGETTILELPYPELEDPADVPSDVELLAMAVEAQAGGIVPIGAMMMWFLPTVPAGGKWLFCDGLPIPAPYTELIALIGANTPDMRDRFPIGVSATKAATSRAGDASVALTKAQMPKHTHVASTGNQSADHTHGPGYNPSYGWQTYFAVFGGANTGFGVPIQGGGTVTGNTQTGGQSTNHSHAVTVNSEGGPVGGVDGSADAHNNMPPYVALNFIIRAA